MSYINNTINLGYQGCSQKCQNALLQHLYVSLLKKMNQNPPFMKEIFMDREIHYNLRVTNNIYAHKPRTTASGLENVSFLEQNLWRDLPLHIKESLTVKHFKKGIQFWNFTYNCRLCKSYIVNLGCI